MKILILILKIILPSILCTLIIITTKISIEFYSLSFGLIIGLLNWKEYKTNPYFGLISIIIISFICFFLAYISFPLFYSILKPIFGEDLSGFISIEVSTTIIAPLLVFFSYKFIFNYYKTSVTKNIIIGVILFLFLESSLFFYLSDSKYIIFLKEIKLNQHSIWQIIMALGIQLIIYQEEIFKTKKMNRLIES